MTRILIRAGKAPFKAVSAHETFDKNIIGSNNGNLLFASAAYKLLSAEGVSVSTQLYGFGEAQAAKASAEYDAFVLPLANAFRPGFEPQLKKITQFIKKLTIPTVMLSGGAQSGPDGTFAHLKVMESTVKDFCRTVLNSSSHITVRGERTAEYIRSLGFSDVLVIGCPSMTMNGPGHKVKPIAVKDSYKIAYNIESSKDLMGCLVEQAEKEHDAVYFPQDMSTFEMMLWGIEKHKAGRDPRLPLRKSHRQFLSNTAEFHLDAHIWIRRSKDFDFSFGPRIHGNVIPILAGTPSVVLAHDSRTQELAEYHEIPHFAPNEVGNVTSLEQVIDRADFTAFNAGHTDRFNKVADFLRTNGLKTIYDEGQESARDDYERSLDAATFPEPQRCEWSAMSPGEAIRLAKQRQTEIELKNLKLQNQKLTAALASAREAFAAL